jgi:hypothetical protein
VVMYAKWCGPDSRWRHLKLPTSLPVPKAITGAHLILRAGDVACAVAKIYWTNWHGLTFKLLLD